MIEIGDALVSFDVLQKKFCCNLHACKGACCVFGDAGAPLTIEEAGDLEDFLDDLSPYISARKQDGVKTWCSDGNVVVFRAKGRREDDDGRTT